jgi:hypothetical protein
VSYMAAMMASGELTSSGRGFAGAWVSLFMASHSLSVMAHCTADR